MSALLAGTGHNNPPPLKQILAENYAALGREVDAIREKANGIKREVKSDADLTTAAELIKEAGAVARRVEDARKVEKEPHLQAGRDVDAFFKVLSESLDRITETFKKLSDAYLREKAAEERRRRDEEIRRLQAEEDRKRREAEEAKRASTAERKTAEADEIANQAELARIEAETATTADLVGKVTSASGVTASGKAVIEFEITDYEAIDLNKLRPYLDRKEVEKAIRALVRFQKLATSLPGVRVFEDVKATFR